ncbi:DUF6438 domain-containing protein [bacterium]|nr:DUF6438 domain-containing protein [bacterium]
MKYIILSIISLTLLLGCELETASTYSNIKGKWINLDNDYIEINDTTTNNNYIGNNVGDLGKHLQIINDTLSFQDRYTSSEDNYSTQRIDKANFKIISISDSFLQITPTSIKATKYFNNDTIELTKQEYAINTDIEFEKITFHTTSCFGKCPVYHLEVNMLGEAKLQIERIYKKNKTRGHETDTMRAGYYLGNISEDDLKHLKLSIQTCNLDNLKFDGYLCCDGSVKTIIVNYSGKRRYLKDMFPPRIADNLINQLEQIAENNNFTKTDIKFELEK